MALKIKTIMKYLFPLSFKQRLLLTLVMATACAPVFAQDSLASKQPATTKKEWNFLLEPYLMLPNMNGQTGIGTLPDVDVDASPGDIFDKLKMAGMFYFEVANDRWAFSSDIIYMSLKQDLTPGKVIQSGEAHAKQFAWEQSAMRRFLPMLDAGIGFRINSMEMGLDMVRNNVGGGTSTSSRSLTETWIDPFIVARFRSDPARKFMYQLRGDIGGFGVGSEFAWQIQAYAGYRFSKLFQVTGGYRILGMDYNKGSGEDRFMYNMDIFGAVVKFGFNL
jgi:hypothetical protein